VEEVAEGEQVEGEEETEADESLQLMTFLLSIGLRASVIKLFTDVIYERS
jgi:hypothetical protein